MPTPAQIQYMQAHIADNKQPDLIAAITICITLAYLAVAARFGARWRVRMPLMADDWWILVALVCVRWDLAESNIPVVWTQRS